MTAPLIERLGLREREFAAFVGAGGKSTVMLALAGELAEAGKRVVVTTTTKMGHGQIHGLPAVCRDPDVEALSEAVAFNSPVALATGGDDHKVTGPPPEVLDGLYQAVPLDYLLVEADGARGRSLKVPAAHEPVIPAEATMVVVLMGVDAVGGRICDVAHRPEQTAALTGLRVTDRLGVSDCVAVLTNPDGGLKGVPESARVVVALTKTYVPGGERSAAQISAALASSERVAAVIVG